MNVSLSWLVVGLFIAILLFLFLQAKGVYDAFQNYDSVKEGFTSASDTTDIQITTCPASLTNFIDSNGMSMCCEGNVENGKCSGQTRCTLSEGNKGIPTCSIWYTSYLANKAIDRCPPSMPNYFEGGGAKGNDRGCASGRRSPDGKGPLDTTVKFCKLYETENDEMIKKDSCSNQTLLDTANAFPGTNLSVQYSLVSLNTNLPPVIQASYINNKSPITCYTNASLERFYDRQKGTSWRDSFPSWDIDEKLQFCSIMKLYKIDKTVKDADLPFLNYNGEGRAPVPAQVKAVIVKECKFNAKDYADANSDLKKAFGSDETKLINHYKQFGINEGRSINLDGCKFDAAKYLEFNPDVKKAGVDAKKHFIDNGIKEGRRIA